MTTRRPQAERREHLHELVEGFDQGMLVTRALNGTLRSRPMVLAEHDRRENLYFVTDEESAKTDEVREHPEVNVSFQSASRYVSASGRATVLFDPVLAREIWSPSMKAWFPDGPDDRDLRILRMTPRRAEYWDVAGPRRLRYFWEMGKAILEGREAEGVESAGPESHGSVDL